MKEFLEFLYKFNTEAFGIQKALLLAALIGVISNLPKDSKSNLHQVLHIVSSTLLATILTPIFIIFIERMFGMDLPPETGYGIASLIGIVGINTIKRFILSKITFNKTKKDDTDNSSNGSSSDTKTE